MALEQKISLKQTQKLIMTPALQQAIKLLPLTRFELVETIQTELTENPLLEEIVSYDEESSDDNQTQEVTKASETTESFDVKEDFTPPEGEESLTPPEIDWETYIQESVGDMGFMGEFSDGQSFESKISKSTTLSDHLQWQLNMSYKTDLEKEIGNLIIGNLDSRGYLNISIEEIAETGHYNIEDTMSTLQLIHSFDPSGVGARDLKECLLIQIKPKNDDDSLAETIIKSNLEYIENMQYEALAKKLDVPLSKIKTAIGIIQTLSPNPAHRFNSEETHYVVPDVIIVKSTDGYKVMLNDDGIPKLTVNPFYRKILTDRRNKSATKEYLENKFRLAIWLIKSIEQRRNTILKVSESIVKFQKNFLDKGILKLKPLVLKDVANDIDMHESTISRVTTNKFMHTPQGIFEFKYFFHSGIESSYGGALSSVSIKDQLKTLIANENPEQPLNDQAIVDLMRKNEVNIARRTVTKYRKELNILTAGKRKRRKII